MPPAVTEPAPGETADTEELTITATETPPAPEPAPEPPPEKNVILREIEELREKARAKDAVTETARAKRRSIDYQIEELLTKKQTLLTDLTKDPLSLGKQVAEIDHAVHILEHRRGPADAEIAAAKEDAAPAWHAVEYRTTTAVKNKLGGIYKAREWRMQKLMTDFGLPWDSPADHIRGFFVTAIETCVFNSQLGNIGKLGPLHYDREKIPDHQRLRFLDDDFDSFGKAPD